MDFGEHLLVQSLFHLWWVPLTVENNYSELQWHADGVRCHYTGTFWLVHGTSMIPWFGVGANYSPTGNALEGEAMPEFFATNG